MIEIYTRAADRLRKSSFKSEHFWLGSFLLLAGTVSIGTAVSLGDTIRFADEQEYMAIARNLINIGTYSIDGNTPTALRPPSWPLLLTVGNLISSNVIWLRLINLALHLGTSLLLMRFIRCLGFPFGAALITSAAYFFFPVLLFAATTFYAQTLSAFLIASMLNIMLVRSLWATVVLGVLASITALAVPGTALVVCIFVFVQAHHLPMRTIPVRLAVFGIAAALTLTPWIVRNYITFGAFVPLSTMSGEALLIGNSPQTRFDTVADLDMSLIEGLTELEANKKMQEIALKWVFSNKREAATLYLEKFLNWFNYQHDMTTKGHMTALTAIIAFVSYYSALIAAIVGSSVWSRSVAPISRPICFWLWLLYILAGLSYAITSTRVRYRIPFEIILFILATPLVANVVNRFDGIVNSAKTGRAAERDRKVT